MNSRSKGARGERELAEFLRAHGFTARRGQQFSGSPDSPDVVSDIGYHIECKRVEKLNLEKACEQAIRDSKGDKWAVFHRKNGGEWMVAITAEEFIHLIRLSQAL